MNIGIIHDITKYMNKKDVYNLITMNEETYSLKGISFYKRHTVDITQVTKEFDSIKEFDDYANYMSAIATEFRNIIISELEFIFNIKNGGMYLSKNILDNLDLEQLKKIIIDNSKYPIKNLIPDNVEEIEFTCNYKKPIYGASIPEHVKKINVCRSCNSMRRYGISKKRIYRRDCRETQEPDTCVIC